MNVTQKIPAQTNTAMSSTPVVREYDIRGYKYIVTATTKAGATEDAAAIVRRLIQKEITANKAKQAFMADN